MVIGNYELIYTATDNSGNRAVDSRFITVSDQGACHNAINEDEVLDAVRLYPNPGNGKFNIEFTGTTKGFTGITIYDAIGTVVYHMEEQLTSGQVKTFDYQDMKPGMYFIQLAQGEKIITIKYNLMK